ncbi:MAG: hypothetical protein V9G19_21815 [Tetrasphaera sp.]
MNPPTRTTRTPAIGRAAVAIAAAAALAGGLTACGNAQVPVKASTTASTPSGQGTSSTTAPSTGTTSTTPPTTSSPVSALPSTTFQSGTGESESRTVDGKEIAGLPKGFPFPEDAKVDLVVAGSMVQLTAPDAKPMAAFYRAALPKAGLPIDFDSGGDSPVLLFENDDWQGQVSVNSDSGALITWGPPLEDTASTSTGTTSGAAGPGQDAATMTLSAP